MPQANHYRSILIFLLFFVWIGMTAYALWWFEFKDLRPFDNDSNGQVYTPDLDRIQASLTAALPAQEQRTVVVHFWNPDCYCNRFNATHLSQIMEEYRDQGVAFYLATANPELSKTEQRAIQREFGDVPVLRLNPDGLKQMIPSSPSAAVIDPNGGITYFGPYSEGAMCSRQSGSFVETVLNKTLQGNSNAQLNTLAFGCYCDW
ncbi:MAG: hypothetical protein HUJ29_05480 [Gammaproteobacteria bacterium]|nr:hypothetical protein [Gammaproteobacteria bacterium]